MNVVLPYFFHQRHQNAIPAPIIEEEIRLPPIKGDSKRVCVCHGRTSKTEKLLGLRRKVLRKPVGMITLPFRAFY